MTNWKLTPEQRKQQKRRDERAKARSRRNAPKVRKHGRATK